MRSQPQPGPYTPYVPGPAPAEHLHVARPRHSLRDNKLGDEGWTALFKALCENKGDKIESWDLSGEGVGPQTAKALAEYASLSPALRSVKCARPPCIQARTRQRPLMPLSPSDEC